MRSRAPAVVGKLTTTRSLQVTDQFCGAGGSSIGAEAAGTQLVLGLNHWKLAIETHNSNFPNAAHDCTDISAADPRRYPSTDILITSPECTNHSLAKGIRRQNQPDLFGTQPDPAAERSRATMWDVPRFAEYHNYQVIIVENVVDARQWVTWDAWLHAMHLLGYEHQIVYFNAMFAHPTPQSRDRMYVIFWKKGHRAPNLDFRPLAYCEHCEKDINAIQTWKNRARPYGKYKTQYTYSCPKCAKQVHPYYYAAANAIDWTLPIQKIGDRKTPLKAKTMRRIEIGLEKFAGKGFMLDTIHTARDDGGSMVYPLTGPGRTLIGQATHALVTPPFIVNLSHSDGDHTKAINAPLPTQTTRQDMAMVVPYYNTGQAQPTTDPMPTLTTVDRHALLTMPFILGYYTRVSGTKAAISDVEQPMPTLPTQLRHYLVQPTEIPDINECGYRMLKPKECQKAMAFPDDYKILGTGREVVKQLGNAVVPKVMEMLFDRIVETFQSVTNG